MKVVCALTGASGAIYFIRLLQRLMKSQTKIECVSSENGRLVLEHETGKGWSEITNGITCHGETNMAARISSGSSPVDAMVIVPCSMSSLSQIAYGVSGNLIHRAAAVQLKERRRLIVVPREAPYSLIHLKAMTSLTEAGAMVLPASPGFYHQPETIEDVVDGVVDRILDHIQCPDSHVQRWQT